MRDTIPEAFPKTGENTTVNRFDGWKVPSYVAVPLSRQKRKYEIWVLKRRLCVWTADIPEDDRYKVISELVSKTRTSGINWYLENRDEVSEYEKAIAGKDRGYLLATPELDWEGRLEYVIEAVWGGKDKPSKSMEAWESQERVAKDIERLTEEIQRMPDAGLGEDEAPENL